MRKPLWTVVALVLIFPAMLFTVSCGKKAVSSSSTMTTPGDDAAERARQEELARQRALEEEKLADERRRAAGGAGMETDRERFVNQDIHFDFDSSSLTPEAQEILRQKADYMLSQSELSVIIEGHCDDRGTSEYNLALGDRRAESAKLYLKDLGVSVSRISTISYGEERPIDTGQNEEAWARNRRAHFVIR